MVALITGLAGLLKQNTASQQGAFFKVTEGK